MGYLGTPIDTRNQFQSLQGKRFNGDGSTTDFTLDVAPGNVLDIEVFVGNVRQDPNSAYTLSGTTLSFTGAPPSGTNNIYVVHQAKSVGTIDVPALGVSTASIQADAITEAKIADDAVESEHLNNNIISGQTALGATPADTDELLISDAGTIKRVDYSYIKGQTNTPYFDVKTSADQDLNHNTATKISFNTELHDSASAYDSSSNYRFTPQTAGRYLIYASLSYYHSGTVLSDARTIIYKNGSAYRQSSGAIYSGQFSYWNFPTSSIIEFNGSSDYVEVYGLHLTSDGGTAAVSEGRATYFGGFLIAT